MLALAVTHHAVIVIIDTTSRVVAGKENDADTYLAFYRHTVVPLRARGIALLRLDHPGKDVSRGTRGSSAKKGDVDTEWLLTKLTDTTFAFDRLKDRDKHGDSSLTVRRCVEPLRHEITSGQVTAPANSRRARPARGALRRRPSRRGQGTAGRRDQGPRNRPRGSHQAPERTGIGLFTEPTPKRFQNRGNRREPPSGQ